MNSKKFFAGMSALALALAGCSAPLDGHQVPNPVVAAYVEKYGAVINSQLDFAQRGFEAVSHYIDLPIMSRAAGGGHLAYGDIGALLPTDISGLRRTLPSNARSGQEIEISLEDELRMLAEEFEASLAAMMPDPEKALSLPYVVPAARGSAEFLI